MSQAAMMGMVSAWNPGAKPQAAVSAMTTSPDATQSSNSAADAGTGITANDFLTLLVTEMQNQDPTADVDPNQYISQLVQINSLEQLISINQNVTALGSSSTGTGSGSGTGSGTGSGSGSGTGAVTGVTGSAFTRGPGVAPSPASAQAVRQGLSKVVHGNMSVPSVSASAETVAASLAPHAAEAGGVGVRAGHAIRDIPLARFNGSSR